jgi:hypothetical protein
VPLGEAADFDAVFGLAGVLGFGLLAAAGLGLAAGALAAAGFGLAAGALVAGGSGAGFGEALVVAPGLAGSFCGVGFVAAGAPAAFGVVDFDALGDAVALGLGLLAAVGFGFLVADVFAVADLGAPGAPAFGAPLFARAVRVVPAAPPVFVPPARGGFGVAAAGGGACSRGSDSPRILRVSSPTANLPTPTAVSRRSFGLGAMRRSFPRVRAATRGLRPAAARARRRRRRARRAWR